MHKNISIDSSTDGADYKFTSLLVTQLSTDMFYAYF